MQLIRLQLDGLKNQSKPLDIDLSILKKKNYDEIDEIITHDRFIRTSKIHGFFGVNASGKTTTSKAITLFYEFARGKYLESILSEEYKRFLNSSFTMKSIYINKGFLYISTVKIGDNKYQKDTIEYVKLSEIKRKKTFENIIENYSFSNIEYNNAKEDTKVKEEIKVNKVIKEEFLKNMEPEVIKILSNISLIHIFSNTKEFVVLDTIELTGFNYFYLKEEDTVLINNIARAMDNNIESIDINDDTDEVILKFKDSRHIITNKSDYKHYLSSGTIRGLLLFSHMQNVFDNGGVLIIDEIETHLNRTYIIEIIKMFKDPEINRQNATLFFTSHTVELLDIFDLYENLHIVTNDSTNIKVSKITDYNIRNDLKASKSFLAGAFNSMPKYDQILTLRRRFKNDSNNS